MQKLTKYEADDGTLFDSAVDAHRRDVLIVLCLELEAMLPSPPQKHYERLEHDPATLKAYRRAVVELCRELFPKEEVFTHDPEEIHPFSWAGRFLSEAAPRCVNHVWHRLMCCNGNTEYQQPFYALNPDKWSGKAPFTNAVDPCDGSTTV